MAAVAAWALKADDKTGWTVGSGVVAAVAGAFSPAVVQWLQGRRQARAGRRRVLVGGLVATLPRSVAWLLHPDQAVVSFFGREWTLQQLQLWCEDQNAAVVRLLTAGGGVGKSRLARHLAEVELTGWVCWRVAVGGEAPIVGALHGDEAPGRLVQLVDYAEARQPAQLAALLCAAAGADGHDGRRVRVLLLARTAGTWWTSLSAAFPQQAALVDALTSPAGNVIALQVRADTRDAQEIVVDAAGQFAARLHYAVPRVPARKRDPGTPLLRLHAEALVAVLGGARSSDGRHDVLAELLGHETRYWRYCAQRAGLTGAEADAGHQRQLVAMAALFGADNDEQAAALLTRVPGLTDAPPEQAGRWVQWLRELYPADSSHPAGAGRLGTLQPDLLAEHLAVDVLQRYTWHSARQRSPH